MGLDMYLYRHEYVSGSSWSDNKETYKAIVDTLGIEPSKDARHINIEVCVAYWRKANAIHKWFCDLDGGRDECQPIYVTRQNLVNLRETAWQAVSTPAMASALLPTQSGFFFGSTEYDQWYMQDMHSTIEQLDKILAATPEDSWAGFIYRASW